MWAESTLKSLQRRLDLIERAAAYRGRPRERMVAIGEADELYIRLYPHHYRAIQTLRVASHLGRTVPGREDAFEKSEKRLIVLLSDVISDGLREGDLWLGKTRTAGELALTIWSLAVGTRSLMDSRIGMWWLGLEDSLRLAQTTSDILMDAIGWRPLSDEWDYAATRQRIAELLSPPDLKQASG